MASIIIASIALALTFLIYAYGGWRFLRYPRFWVTSASAKVRFSSNKLWLLYSVAVSVAFRGGGQERNIIDMGFVVFDRETTVVRGWMEEVINVPRELGGRFNVEIGMGPQVSHEGKVELPCSLRLDCGGEPFEIPFSLRGPGDTWSYDQPSFSGPLFSARLQPRGPRRLLHWILSR